MKLRTYLLSLVAIAAFAAGINTAAAQEWTRFRGPNGTGESEAPGIPATWGADEIRWKVEIPGVGHSSPVIWGNKLFLISADPKTAKRFVLCFDTKSGKELWRREYASAVHHLHVRSSYASSTPAVDADRVIVAWSDPEHTWITAIDHAGRDLWQVDLGTWISQHGFGTSPLLYEDLVIIASSQEQEKRPGGLEAKESFIVGLDKTTGKRIWRTERRVDTASYSVPCIHKTPEGADELVFLSTAEGFFAIDPKTGRENWAHPAFSMRTVSSPIQVDGLLLGTTGSGGGGNYVVAIQPGKTSKTVYEIKKEAPYVPTPVAKGSLIFLWSDKGIVTCINAADGKQVWQKRVGGAGYSGSPIRVGDKLFCVDEAGVVVCIKAGDSFEELGRTDLGEECRSTPAVANGQIFVRTVSHLVCAGPKGK